VIEGGQSVNTIAAEARLLLDMRSEESKTLAAFEAQVREQVNAAAQPGLTFSVQVVGDRPAGRIAPEHPLVRCAMDVLGHLGVHGTLENSSTDANIPLSMGLPAVTVGITSGDNAHRLDEYIDTPFIASGLKQLLLLTLLVAERSF
jgi:acetylornithine deacetylase/succinyl-diaminopimelate desuccinylase-like protein